MCTDFHGSKHLFTVLHYEKNSTENFYRLAKTFSVLHQEE